MEPEVLIAQRIERSPAKAEIEVQFLVGTQKVHVIILRLNREIRIEFR